jgi:hypothetical protein
MNRLAGALILSLSLAAPALRAAPRDADAAQRLARGWLRVAAYAPLHERLSAVPGEAEPVIVGGQTVGYVFNLRPRGFIITSADDAVEPVIAFSRTGHSTSSDGSPLDALLRADLPQRLAAAPVAPGTLSLQIPEATRKWALFSDAADGAGEAPSLANNGLSSSPADLRVAPLVQSRWGQDVVKASGLPCYNYYTPNNYYCGCNGTSWGQIMRYHQYPTNGIGRHPHTIYVDGVATTAYTRGGNGTGGPYAWSSMPLLPDGSTTDAQRQAIGALTYDIVVAVSTNPSSGGAYSSYTSAGTSSYVPPFLITGTFKYASAIRFEASVNRTNAINANLDAGYPVNVVLPNHAVVCDGYGFQSGTAYHHLNMGWDGYDDAWYTLGDVNAGGNLFTGLEFVIANIFPGVTGEIVSGRVLDSGGAPLSGVTVTLAPGGRTDVTDSAGIYGFAGVASGSTVTLTAAKAGYLFAAKYVTLGTSQNESITCGNRTGNDFTGALSGSFHLVSGRIVSSASNGLSNIAVDFSNGGGSTLTDGSGNYAQALPIGWSGTVTPTATPGYFEPAAYAVANLQADTAGFNFVGTLMRFVKASATGANNGSSWADAYTNLVTALGNTPVERELWVAAGTYKPAASSRDNAFVFNAGQAALGGFTGTETRREQRDWRLNPTILSGDIGILNTVTDNCYTVVRGADGARIDGFTVTGGNASYAYSYATEDELARGFGGGVFIWDKPTTESASFVVDHCVVTGNRANNDQAGPGDGLGAGLFRCLARNSVLRQNIGEFGSASFESILENCTVVSNTSTANAAVYGGAMTNAVVYYNSGSGGNLYAASLTAGYTCTTPLPSGTGNISSDPKFVNALAGNFMIATNSPCKNAGVARPWMTSAQDYFGDSRSSGTAPDMGAYELQATHPVYDQRPESPLKSGSTFTVSVLTRYGWKYQLQYRASLTNGSWQNVSGVIATGDGTVKTLTENGVPAGPRFYRVYAQ